MKLGMVYWVYHMNRKSTSQWTVAGKWCVLGFIPKKTCKQVLEIIMDDRSPLHRLYRMPSSMGQQSECTHGTLLISPILFGQRWALNISGKGLLLVGGGFKLCSSNK